MLIISEILVSIERHKIIIITTPHNSFTSDFLCFSTQKTFKKNFSLLNLFNKALWLDIYVNLDPYWDGKDTQDKLWQ